MILLLKKRKYENISMMNFLIVILFMSFFADVVQFFEVAGYGVNLTDFAFLAVFILFLKKVIWDGEELKFTLHPGVFFLLLIIFSALISGLTPLIKGSTPQMIQYVKTTVHFLFLVFFTVVCTFYRFDIKGWNGFVKSWLILSIFINLFGIYQIFARAYDLPLAWLQFSNVSLSGRYAEDLEGVQQLSLRYGGFFRATSIFTEPSALALFNVLIQVFIIAPFMQKRKAFLSSSILNVIIFTISLITLLLCFSMTGFVGMGLIIGGVLMFHRSKRLKPFIIGIIASIVIIVAADGFVKSFAGTSVVELFSKRLTGLVTEKQGTEGESVGVRLFSAKVGLEIWEEHFLIGTGLGLTSFNNRKNVEFGDFSFITAMAEMGLLGLIAFMGIFVSLFIISIQFILRQKILSELPEDLQRWSGLLFFMMLHLFLINFISGNNLVSFLQWQLIAVVYANINEIYLRTGRKHYKIFLFKKSMKQSFNENINKYLNGKSVLN